MPTTAARSPLRTALRVVPPLVVLAIAAGCGMIPPEPKTEAAESVFTLYNIVLAMGACASGGGPFKEGYNVVSGIDKFLPVDVYVPGCPPTPQALLYGFMTLIKKLDGQSLGNRNSMPWYSQGPSDAVPIPILGPDIVDPRQLHILKRQSETPVEAPADETLAAEAEA